MKHAHKYRSIILQEDSKVVGGSDQVHARELSSEVPGCYEFRQAESQWQEAQELDTSCPWSTRLACERMLPGQIRGVPHSFLAKLVIHSNFILYHGGITSVYCNEAV